MTKKIAKSPFSRASSRLPRWDLSQLYPGIDSDELLADMERVEEMAAEFKESYEDKIGNMTGEELAEALSEYEGISALSSKILRYGALLVHENSGNAVHTAIVDACYARVCKELDFFDSAVMEMDNNDLLTKLRAPELAKYAPWIAGFRSGSADLPGSSAIKLSSNYQDTNDAALARIYSETIESIGQIREEEGVEELFARISNPNYSTRERGKWRNSLAAALAPHGLRLAAVYNAVAQNNWTEAAIRKCERPDQLTNIQAGLTQEIVESMQNAIKDAYPRVSHRLYAWKAKVYGVDKLKRAMAEAAIYKLPKKAMSGYKFDFAKTTVIDAARKFSPKIGRIVESLFAENRVDAEPRHNKNPHGFAMPVGGGELPFLLLNYRGSFSDVITALAHECGHGAQFALVGNKNTPLVSDVSHPVAEIASLFMEMLVFDEMMKKESVQARKNQLLMTRVEDMINTSLGMASDNSFELHAHDLRKQGPLTAEKMSELWIDCVNEYRGPAVETDALDKVYWMRREHIFTDPFYLSAYPFAQLSVLCLYKRFKEACTEGRDARREFVDKMVNMLEAGSTRSIKDLFRPFDLDPTAAEFWQEGIAQLEKYVDDLEQMDISQSPLAETRKTARARPQAMPKKK